MFIISRTGPWLLALSVGLLSVTAVNAARQCAQGGEMRCMIDPCMVSDCPGVPQATCEPNYCGGCNADFYMNGIQVLSADCRSGSGASALTKKASSSSSSSPSSSSSSPSSSSSSPSSTPDKRQPARPKIPVFGTPPGAGNDLGGMFPDQPPLSPPVDLIGRLSSINGRSGLQEELELLMGGGADGGRNLNRDTRSSFRSGSRRSQRGGRIRSNRPPFLGGSRGTEFIPGGNRGTETFPRGNGGSRPPFLAGNRGTVFVPSGGTETFPRGNRSNRPPFLGGSRGTEFIPGGNGGNRPPFLDGSRSSRFPRPSSSQQRSRSSQRSSSLSRQGRGGRQASLNNFFRNFFGSNGQP